jgi:uncharacterized protein (DUF2147 family)
MKPLFPALLCLAGATALAQPAGADDTLLGRWITESGNLEVEIAPCGEAVWCGTVVKVLANRSMSRPGEAMAPADPRSPLGMTLLSGLKPTGDGEFKGELYNRENGKLYSATVRPLAPAQLRVRGYVGLPLFGKTQVWRRPRREPADAASGAGR